MPDTEILALYWYSIVLQIVMYLHFTESPSITALWQSCICFWTTMCSFSLDFVILLIYNVHVSIVCILTNLNKGLFSVCFISISLRRQFVCVRVASFVFLKFFCVFFVFYEYSTLCPQKQSQRTFSIILFRTMKFYNFILESIRLLLQPPVSGVAVSLLVSGLTVDILSTFMNGVFMV